MADYPREWEADVVLLDGGTCHLRPIRPDDAGRLVSHFARLSPETIYRRFFMARRELTPREVERFTHVDYVDRVALVATISGELVALASYDRLLPSAEAEVAFLVEDAHQGRGLGSVLLEHLAAAARERGIGRFVAEVLPGNRSMVGVFTDAGYAAQRQYGDGVVRLTFPVAPTELSQNVMRAREHRAEARSIERLLAPTSVAVIGASREPVSVGQALLRSITSFGFAGNVFAVNPAGGEIAGIPAYRSVLDIEAHVDLAVVATPAPQVRAVVDECARKGVHGLVIVSSGFAESGQEGADLQRSLVAAAHESGMRVVGPNCLGVINTDDAVRLNATLAARAPGRGNLGFFCHAGALGVAILEELAERGMGLSTFVSAGNRADVSGNDLLQFWEDDPATDAVLLYLESFGNPRKFGRLARRVARRKSVVVVKSGRSLAGPPAWLPKGVSSPEPAVEALFQQAGVIRVDTLSQLLDMAALVAHQPLPAGPRVAVVGNSAALAVIAADACPAAGLEVTRQHDVGAAGSAEDFRVALVDALRAEDVDAVVTVFIPPLYVPNAEVADVLATEAATSDKPVVSTFYGFEGLPAQLRAAGPVAGRHAVPSFRSPEAAVQALGRAAGYARWRARSPGTLPDLEDVDPGTARDALAGRDGWLDRDAISALLAGYGVPLLASRPVASAAEAVAAADALGYPVVVKATAERLRHRPDLGGVRLDLAGPDDVRAAYAALTRLEAAAAVVQPMAAPGVPVVIGVREHPWFGAVVSFGLGGLATDLLGDVGYRSLPLTDVDAHDLVRSVRAAPLLFGHRGAAPVAVTALEQLLLRVARLADDVPEIAEVELNPVLVGAAVATVVDARVRVQPPPPDPDLGPRRLQ